MGEKEEWEGRDGIHYIHVHACTHTHTHSLTQERQKQ